MHKQAKYEELLSKLINDGWTNMYEWVEKIFKDFCEE